MLCEIYLKNILFEIRWLQYVFFDWKIVLDNLSKILYFYYRS